MAASSGTASNFGLVEAQIIGLAVALGGALAVLLRPVRHRPSVPAGQRRQRRTDRADGAAGRARFWPPQFGPLRWHRDK